MSILMFSGMRKPILSLVFRKKYCKVYIYANMNKNKRNRSETETAANIVLADSFFPVLIMLG